MIAGRDWLNGISTGKSEPGKVARKKEIPYEDVYLWVVRASNSIPEILFQHRARNKDSYPDCLDITVGGHVPFGKKNNKKKNYFQALTIFQKFA